MSAVETFFFFSSYFVYIKFVYCLLTLVGKTQNNFFSLCFNFASIFTLSVLLKRFHKQNVLCKSCGRQLMRLRMYVMLKTVTKTHKTMIFSLIYICVCDFCLHSTTNGKKMKTILKSINLLYCLRRINRSNFVSYSNEISFCWNRYYIDIYLEGKNSLNSKLFKSTKNIKF